MFFNPCNIEFILGRLLALPGPIAARLALRWSQLWSLPTGEHLIDAAMRCPTLENMDYFNGRAKPSAFNLVTVRISGFSNPLYDGQYHLMKVGQGAMISRGGMVTLNSDGTVRELQSLRDTVFGVVA